MTRSGQWWDTPQQARIPQRFNAEPLQVVWIRPPLRIRPQPVDASYRIVIPPSQRFPEKVTLPQQTGICSTRSRHHNGDALWIGNGTASLKERLELEEEGIELASIPWIDSNKDN